MPVPVDMTVRSSSNELNMRTSGGTRKGRRQMSNSVRAKLERSRQSARECRARKKLRYQYLEELVATREKAIFALRDELNTLKQWCIAVDRGEVPKELATFVPKQDAAAPSDNTSDAPPALQPVYPSVLENELTDIHLNETVDSCDSLLPFDWYSFQPSTTAPPVDKDATMSSVSYSLLSETPLLPEESRRIVNR